jgi:hypothetical protein
MSAKTYILVFPGGAYLRIEDAFFLNEILERGDTVYAIDGNMAFLFTVLSIETLTTRLKKTSRGNEQFFIVDISKSDRAGNMVQTFWDFLRQRQEAEVA